jgi:ubiquitin carboxyl-terminal hydrolase 25/28
MRLTQTRYNGSGFGGHWWIYIRDFKNNVWRSYNDAIVTVVSEEEVFRKRDPMKEPAASLVVYVKDDKKDELCDPLHRIKPETEADDDGDLDMGWPSNPNGAEIEVREVEMMEVKSLLD